MIDNFDLAILAELQNNGKTTQKELSQVINLSLTPTFERVKKLEKEGYITGYHAHLDVRKLGYNLTALCYVSLRIHQKDVIEKFQKEVVSFEEVRSCFHIAGQFDFLLKVVVKDMTEYQQFISTKLASLENIGNVQSSFVLTELKQEFGLKL